MSVGVWVSGLLMGIFGLVACNRSSTIHAIPPVTINIAGLNLTQSEQLKRDALDELSNKLNIQAYPLPTLGTSTEQLTQTLRLLTQHARAPDVYVVDVIWLGTLGEHLLDLTTYLDNGAREHLPQLLANDTFHGRVVSLPFYLNVGMLYYRRDLLEKYGYLHPPNTWSELETMAKRIQGGERAAGNRHFWGYVWQGSPYEGLTCNALEWQASFGGGRIIEPDGTITVNNSNTIRALRQATAWIGTISPPSVLSYMESDTLNAFRSGNAAFMRYWSGGVPLDTLPHRSEVTLLPAGLRGRSQTMGGFQLAVSRHSAHASEAARLVIRLTGADVQLRRAIRRGYLPTIPRLYDEPDLFNVVPQAAALRRAGLDAWVARPSTVSGPKYAMVSKAYYQTVHEVLSRRLSVEKAIANLEKQLIHLTGFHTGREQ